MSINQYKKICQKHILLAALPLVCYRAYYGFAVLHLQTLGNPAECTLSHSAQTTDLYIQAR